MKLKLAEVREMVNQVQNALAQGGYDFDLVERRNVYELVWNMPDDKPAGQSLDDYMAYLRECADQLSALKDSGARLEGDTGMYLVFTTENPEIAEQFGFSKRDS